ncbi:MAG: adenylate/guanylate cyclase domain-containing protein, partial [Chloroflexota bacterium]
QGAFDQLTAPAERQRESQLQSVLLNGPATFATWDGQLERALELADVIVTHGQQTGSEAGARQYAGRARRRALLYLGRAEEVLASIPTLPTLWAVGGALAAQRAVYLAHAGQTEAARAILDQFLAEHDFAAPDDRSAATLVRFLLEAAVAAGHQHAAAIFEPLAAPMADLLFTEANLTNCVGRDLGGAARLLGQPEKARGYYQRGIAICQKGRHRPELALCRLELAELLLDVAAALTPTLSQGERGLRAEALEHLDFAVSEFQAMQMQTFLERALRRKLQLQGVDSVSPSTSIDALTIAVKSERRNLQPHAAPDGTVTLLFTDIEDSTGLTVRLGDQRWLEILRSHHALIRQQVHDHGGFEVKSQGDGFMLAFGSARRALDCAVAIQRAVEASNAAHPDAAIHVRIGLHTGEALKEADDFHGKHVVLAARIANQARGGEILVSSLLRDLTQTLGTIRFDDARDIPLKGLEGLHRIFAVNWSEGPMRLSPGEDT